MLSSSMGNCESSFHGQRLRLFCSRHTIVAKRLDTCRWQRPSGLPLFNHGQNGSQHTKGPRTAQFPGALFASCSEGKLRKSAEQFISPRRSGKPSMISDGYMRVRFVLKMEPFAVLSAFHGEIDAARASPEITGREKRLSRQSWWRLCRRGHLFPNWKRRKAGAEIRRPHRGQRNAQKQKPANTNTC